jgi:hypothetical protein
VFIGGLCFFLKNLVESIESKSSKCNRIRTFLLGMLKEASDLGPFRKL